MMIYNLKSFLRIRQQKLFRRNFPSLVAKIGQISFSLMSSVNVTSILKTYKETKIWSFILVQRYKFASKKFEVFFKICLLIELVYLTNGCSLSICNKTGKKL